MTYSGLYGLTRTGDGPKLWRRKHSKRSADRKKPCWQTRNNLTKCNSKRYKQPGEVELEAAYRLETAQKKQNMDKCDQCITVRPSLSVSVRLCTCCTFSIYHKTNQLFFISQRRDQFYLHTKQAPQEKPKKRHVKSTKAQCNNKCNKQCTIFVMTYLALKKERNFSSKM